MPTSSTADIRTPTVAASAPPLHHDQTPYEPATNEAAIASPTNPKRIAASSTGIESAIHDTPRVPTPVAATTPNASPASIVSCPNTDARPIGLSRSTRESRLHPNNTAIAA